MTIVLRSKSPPVLGDLKQEESSKSNNREIINNINDTPRGENARSAFEEKHSKSSFNNPLISEEDLKDPNGFQYDTEIINNIDRPEFSDQWYCKNKDCKIRGDKWLLMRHNCKYKK